MRFKTYDEASEFIDKIRPALDAGNATAIGPDGAIVWRPMSRTHALGAWDRLCIVGSIYGPVDVFIERTPENALRDNLAATLVTLTRIKGFRVADGEA